MSYKLDDYNYDLPSELIAQFPAEPRDSSKLLIVNRENGTIEKKIFRDITDYFRKGDLLVLNDTKVIPARLYGQKDSGANIEILLLEQIEDNIWKVLLKPGKRVKIATVVNIAPGFDFIIREKGDTQSCVVQFNTKRKDFFHLLETYGKMPLPPYIKRNTNEYDRKRYQTVYAKKLGAVASPTAGLHFTPSLLESLKNIGVDIQYVTLRVGWGTFKQITSDNITEHTMDEEYFSITSPTLSKLNYAKQDGRRIFAVGTTVVRTLESLTDQELSEGATISRKTGIFIYPPYKPRIVDNLITNFHLPRTSLLLLVSSFAGRENILKAYSYAVKNQFRFYSYGDAMLII